MGRPSKLSEAQIVEAQRRRLDGETWRAIAQSMKVSESALRERISAETAQIKTVANQIVETERAIMALPIPAQITAHNHAARLRAISDNLASAAHYGAQTAHRLNALANSEVQKVDDAQPLASVENLKGVAVLTKLANDSATIALNLIAANKETVTKLNDEKPERQKLDTSKVSSQALEELLTARGA
jgi:hypothetical protein